MDTRGLYEAMRSHSDRYNGIEKISYEQFNDMLGDEGYRKMVYNGMRKHGDLKKTTYDAFDSSWEKTYGAGGDSSRPLEMTTGEVLPYIDLDSEKTLGEEDFSRYEAEQNPTSTMDTYDYEQMRIDPEREEKRINALRDELDSEGVTPESVYAGIEAGLADVEKNYGEALRRRNEARDSSPTPIVTGPAYFRMEGMYDDSPEARAAANYGLAKELYGKAGNMMDASFKGSGLFRGIKDTALDWDTWTSGLTKMVNDKRLDRLYKKVENGETLTADEGRLLDAATYYTLAGTLQQLSSPSVAYSIGKGFTESVPYMIEFALTYGSASSVTRGLARAVSKKLGRNVSNKIAKSGVKVLAEGTEAAATGAVQTLMSPGRIAADTQERMMGDPQVGVDKEGKPVFLGRGEGDDFWTALGKSAGAQYITNISEVSGVIPVKVFRFLSKPAQGAIRKLTDSKYIKAIRESDFVKGARAFGKPFKIGSAPEELFEEYLDGTLNASMIGDTDLESLYSWRSLSEIAGVVLLTQATMGGLGMVKNNRFKGRLVREYGRAEESFSRAVPDKDERDLIATYMNLNMNKTEGATPFDVLARQAAEAAVNRHANDFMREDGSFDTAAAEKYRVDVTKAISGYFTVKPLYDAYLSGITGRKKQDEERIREEVAGKAAGESGQIITVILQDGRRARVTGGNVVLTPDGRIDVEKTGDHFTAVYEDDGTAVQLPADDSYRLEVVGVEDAVQAAVGANNGMIAREEEEAVYGPRPQIGELVYVRDSEGNPVALAVGSEVDENGNFTAVATRDYDDKVKDFPVTVNMSEIVREGESSGGTEGVDEYQTFVDTGTVSDDVVSRIANKITAGESLTPEEESMRQGASERVEGSLRQIKETQSALSRIPKDEKGNPVYEQADPEMAWNALLEQADGDVSVAQDVADSMVKDKEAALKKMEKTPAKGTTPAEKLADAKKRRADIEKARAELEHWQRIAGVAGARVEGESEAVENTKKTGNTQIKQESEQQAYRETLERGDARNAGYLLSDEVDENGRPFVLNSNGEIVFGEIGEDTGLTPAPILLSEGVISNFSTGSGYGLVHIEARHGEQIRNAGYKSVPAFVEEVAKNYERIKEGKDRAGNKTYILQLTDKHNNTLMVELSGDESYWNINSAGIFNTKYAGGSKVLYSRHTQTNQPVEVGEGSPTAEQSDSPTVASTLPSTTLSEDSERSGEKQGVGEKNVQPASETVRERNDNGAELQEGDSSHSATVADRNDMEASTSGLQDVAGSPSARQGVRDDRGGVDETSLQREVRKFGERMAERLGGGIRFVYARDIPESEANYKKKREAYGYYDTATGEVVVVLDNHTSKGVPSVIEVAKTIMHEVVGHKGVRGLLGEEGDAFFDDVYRGMKARSKAELESKYGGQLTRRVGESEADFELRRRRLIADEYIAQIAERGNNPGLLRRVIAKIREVLRGLGVDLAMTDNDIRNVLRQSTRELTRRKNAELNVDEEGDIRYRIEDINERFNEELERYQKGEMGNNEMFHLGNPDGVMRMFLPDLPIVMRPRIINKASHTKHNVGIESMKDLPRMISEPIFVFKRSDKALGVLTEIKDRDGLNVCVAIEMQKNIQDGGAFLEVNDIRSIHGRNAENLIKPIVDNNTLVYADKEKGLDWLSSASSNYQQEIDNQDLSTATNIVKEFENPKVGGENVRYRAVYHGSPADFERFDHSFMGTGEGAQAYGWGTYVTEVDGIARSYAENLSGRDYVRKINRLSYHVESQKDFIKTRKRDIKRSEDYEKYAKTIRRNLRNSQKEYKVAERAGNEKDMEFYQSLIRISEQQLLPEHHKHLIDSFWDDINNAQADIDRSNAEMVELKKKLKELEGNRHLYTVEIPDDTGENYLDWTGRADRYIDVAGISTGEYEANDMATGEDVYRYLAMKLGSDKAASEFLSRAGFTGIKYPAEATTGGRADGAKNYVIFDERDLDIRDHIRFRLTEEEQDIVENAKRDGSYMKAPNGEPTQLNEKQWAQVRTRAFKAWFGDWEKAARIGKLRGSSPVEISGEEITPSDDLKQYKKNALEYGKRLQGEYTNKDTGRVIQLQRGRKNGGLKEVLQHDINDAAHIQSVAAIPQIIENAVYIDSAENRDVNKNPQVAKYHYYVCGLKIGGEDYTVRMVEAEEKDGSRYYDHKLTHVEKGKLIDELALLNLSSSTELSSTPGTGTGERNRPTNRGETQTVPVSDVKDKQLLSILQTNASKVVDENGEPQVVYHGTPLRRDQITPNRGWQKDGKTYVRQQAPFHTFKGGEYSGLIFTSIDAEKARSIAEKRAQSIPDDADGTEQWTDEGFVYDLYLSSKRPFDPGNEEDIKAVLETFGGKIPTLSFYGGKGDEVSMEEALKIASGQRNSWLVTETPVFLSKIKELGYDGLVGYDEGVKYFAVTSPNQLKDAYENTGAFSAGSDDIRYRAAEADYDGVRSEAEREYESALDAPMDFSVAEMMPIEAARNAETARILRDMVQRFPDTKIAITDISRIFAAADVERTESAESTSGEIPRRPRNGMHFAGDSSHAFGMTGGPSARGGVRDDVRYRQGVNGRFNDELQQQIDGTLPKGHVYGLGRPSEVLLAAGIPDLPIELAASRLGLKASAEYESNHPFELGAVMNLPEAIQHPIAVFDSKTRVGSKVILVELKDRNGNNFVVAMNTNVPKSRYSKASIQINDIRSIYPKDNVLDIMNWINRGDLLRYADKKKIEDWITQQRSNSAEVEIQNLDVAANIVENFENPKIGGENTRYRIKGLQFDESNAPHYDTDIRGWDRGSFKERAGRTAERVGISLFDEQLKLKQLQNRVTEWLTGSKKGDLPDGLRFYDAENQAGSIAKDRKMRFDNEYKSRLFELRMEVYKALGNKVDDKYYYYAKTLNERIGVIGEEKMAANKATMFSHLLVEKNRGHKFPKGFTDPKIYPYEALQDYAREQVRKESSQKGSWIDSIEGYIADCENRMGDKLVNDIWGVIGEISEYELTTSFKNGLITRDHYDILMYGQKLSEIVKGNLSAGKITGAQYNAFLSLDLTAEELHKAGFLTDEQFEGLKRRYAYYLPLKGDSEPSTKDKEEYEGRLSLLSFQVKDVEGDNTRLANDPVSRLLADVYAGISYQEKMSWIQSMYQALRLAERKGNGAGDFAILDRWVMKDEEGNYVPYFREVDGNPVFTPTEGEIASGEVVKAETLPVGTEIRIPEALRGEHLVRVKHRGRTITVYFRDPGVARAVNEHFVPRKTPGWIKWSRAVTQFMSKVMTQWNVYFTYRNLFKDFGEAATNNYIQYGSSYLASYTKNYGRVMSHPRILMQAAKRTLRAETPYEKMVEEFFKYGGEVSYTQMESYEKTLKDFEKELRRSADKNGVLRIGKRSFSKIGEAISDMNKIAELNARVATFITSREMGYGLRQSIRDAKEVTVNFDRRGKSSRGFGTYFLFWNAGRQSNRRKWELMRENPGRFWTSRAAMGLLNIAQTYVFGAALSAIFGVDWEDYMAAYYDIPDYMRYNNIVILSPGGNVYRIPLSPAFAPYKTLVENVGEAVYRGVFNDKDGKYDLAKGVGDILKSLSADLGDPTNWEAKDLGQKITAWAPAPAVPLFEAIFNVDFTGRPLYKEGNTAAPGYKKAYQRTDQIYVDISEWLNEATGGEPAYGSKIGRVVNPGVMEHVIEGFLGGLIQIGTKLYNIPGSVKEGRYERLPFVDTFYFGDSEMLGEREVRNDIYEARKIVKKYNDTKGNIKRGGLEERDENGRSSQWIRDNRIKMSKLKYALDKYDDYTDKKERMGEEEYRERIKSLRRDIVELTNELEEY